MMSEKNNNYTRKCVITHEILDVSQLIRFDYKKETNIISLDLNKTKNGRGCYLKNDPNLWSQFIKTKALNRAFRTNVNLEVYNNIYNELTEVLWKKS
ncbi:YlxR family protein [Mycoplasma anserisalpingitidis]